MRSICEMRPQHRYSSAQLHSACTAQYVWLAIIIIIGNRQTTLTSAKMFVRFAPINQSISMKSDSFSYDSSVICVMCVCVCECVGDCRAQTVYSLFTIRFQIHIFVLSSCIFVFVDEITCSKKLI